MNCLHLHCVILLSIFLVVHGNGGSSKSEAQQWLYLGTLRPTGNPDQSFGKEFIEKDYYASLSAAPWNIAIQDCKAIFNSTAHLLSLESKEESDSINLWLQDHGASPGYYWTSGIYDVGQEVWRWAGHLEADFDNFTNWGDNEPMATLPITRISLHFFNQLYSGWETRDDTLPSKYICEVPHIETEPTPTISPTTTPDPVDPTSPTTTLDPITTPVPTNPIPCTTKTGLVIVLDSSLAMTPRNFETAKEFSANLASAFTSLTTSKVGFITFALSSTIVVQLSSSFSPEIIQGKILAANFIGMTHRMTHDGMTYAKLQLETYAHGAPWRMVVITNGLSDLPSYTKSVADVANLVGVKTFAVGISSSANDRELLDIAHGDSSRVFRAGWENIMNILPSISEAVCR